MMRGRALALFSVLAFASIGYACDSSDDDKPETDASGGAGRSAGAGGKAGRGGGGGSTAAGFTGDAGSPAQSGGAGESSGATGGGGSGSEGGTGNDGGVSSGRSGDGGSVGGDAGAPAAEVGVLLGPTKDNQAPILLGPAHLMGEGCADYTCLLAVDHDGNVLIHDASILVGDDLKRLGFLKLDPDFELVWRKKIELPFAVVAMSVTEENELLLGGYATDELPGETAKSTRDAMVGKLATDGEIAWMHQWGPAALTNFIVEDSDGSIVTTAVCDGQAPGNPPDYPRGPVLARFSAAGDEEWLTQYDAESRSAASSVVLDSLLTGADGSIYTSYPTFVSPQLANIHTFRLDQTGAELSRTVEDPVLAPSSAAFSADKKRIYRYGGKGSRLSAHTLDGSPIWTRTAVEQTAVIDDIEGTVWTGTIHDSRPPGSFGDLSLLAVSAEGIYVAGQYANSYEKGSLPPPRTQPAFVARYDLEGNRVWFQEFMIDQDPLDLTETQILNPWGLALDPQGNPIVLLGGRGPLETAPGVFKQRQTWYLVRLNAANGAPTP